MNKVSLKDIKVIDVHGHPFHPTDSPMEIEQFVRNLSLSVQPNMFIKQDIDSHTPYPGTNMFVQMLVVKLADYFSCKPTLRDVLNERNKRALHFDDYVKNLIRDANLAGILLDYSYPTPAVNKNKFSKQVDIPSFDIYRIEPVMDQLRESCESFSMFLEFYRNNLKNALRVKTTLGLKSIIAYRSGLEIEPMNYDSAEKQYEDFKKDGRATVKNLRDYCFHIALEECTEADKVMHIHTGVGDGDIVLDKASPKLLLSTLREPKYQHTKVHLVHGGYPWFEEAAFIVSILPNVYMDISLQIPFTGHGAERILSQVFEFAPFDKVLYGSDAINVPEIYWFGVSLFKENLERVLNEWVDRSYMNVQMATAIGEMVLYKNFMDIYGPTLKDVFQ